MTALLTLNMSYISTPIGKMIALADSHSLHLLEFECQEGLKRIQTYFQITQVRNSVIYSFQFKHTQMGLIQSPGLKLFLKGIVFA
jgi:hypothetical protein